jgi:hypothetical protein
MALGTVEKNSKKILETPRLELGTSRMQSGHATTASRPRKSKLLEKIDLLNRSDLSANDNEHQSKTLSVDNLH